MALFNGETKEEKKARKQAEAEAKQEEKIKLHFASLVLKVCSILKILNL